MKNNGLMKYITVAVFVIGIVFAFGKAYYSLYFLEKAIDTKADKEIVIIQFSNIEKSLTRIENKLDARQAGTTR